jgi:hypothetical protein
VSVLYPRNRQLSPRVRLFIDWIVERFAAANLIGVPNAQVVITQNP